MNDLGSLSKRRTSGFTLVEILVVIAIIGILAGIAIPAVTSALRTAKEAAIRTDIDVMSQALEAYKLKHGDYPPDFSDWNAVERHFRKAFPSIDNNELRILAQFTHYNGMLQRTGEATGSPPADPRPRGNGFDHYPHAIDRAESLVFCLGGLSSDAKRPFTGQGGPLVLISGASLPATPAATDYLLFQYNSERESGFFDFDITNLSITLYTAGNGPLGGGAGSGSPYAYTIDEDSTAGTIGPHRGNSLRLVYYADPFPTYHPPSSELPVVYFSSRNYNMAWGGPATVAWSGSPGHHMQNLYLPNGAIDEKGVARPYASNVVDTTPPSTLGGNNVYTGTGNAVLQFAEDTKFQLVSAGLDNNYGGVLAPEGFWGGGELNGNQPAAGICIYPSGEYYNPLRRDTSSSAAPFNPPGTFATVSSANKFQDDYCLSTHYGVSNPIYRAQPQLDNVTNFSTRTLESDLP